MTNNYSHPPQSNNTLGMTENTYLMLMHLSQLAGFITAGLGFLIPLVMWLINKDKNKNVDRHGRNILNFMISWFIYIAALSIISLILMMLIITIPLSIIGFALVLIIALLEIIFIIIATIKASSGEYWQYPASISFFYNK